MTTQYVQIMNGAVVKTFASPQDPEAFPGYAELADTDALYQAYIAPVTTSLAYVIAEARWVRETADVTVDGMQFLLDDATQSKLSAAYVRASRNAALSFDWKLSTGTYVSLTSKQLLAIGDQVYAYVQACFTREKDLLKAVADGTYQATMLAEGWPATVLSTGTASA